MSQTRASSAWDGRLQMEPKDWRRLMNMNHWILCERDARDYRAFWGDLHVHTELSYDAAGTPARQTIEYARDGSCLDFMALTEHYQAWQELGFTAFYGGSKRMKIYWDLCRLFIKLYTEPGKFIMFLAYEGGQQKMGHKEYHPRYHGMMHKNVYYRSDDGPIEPSTDYFEYYYGAPEWNGRVIVVPHHTRYPIETTGQDWNHHDARLQRLVLSIVGRSDMVTEE
jgi:hypothetical protein